MTAAELFPDSLNAALRREHAGWKERVRVLDAHINKAQIERDQLAKKIDAAEVILGISSAPEGDEPSLQDKVLEVMNDGKARTPNELRYALQKIGVPANRVSTKTGYYYTTLSRMVDRDLLAKEGKRYRYVPQPVPLKRDG